jgi:hypothetical protein
MNPSSADLAGFVLLVWEELSTKERSEKIILALVSKGYQRLGLYTL